MDDCPEFHYPEPDLGVYQKNQIGKCKVMSVEVGSPNIVYIVNEERPFSVDLNNNLLARLADLPTPGHVFAIRCDASGLHRAVRNYSYEELPATLLLIDSGSQKKLDSLSDVAIYEISEEAQVEPATIIQCNVVEFQDENGNEISIGNVQQCLNTTMHFRIISREGASLAVSLRKINSVAPFDTKNTCPVSEEQRKILFEEEPEGTSNALKAVMGYVPQDEKRNCPFYDSKTKRCFKGNHCRLQHVPILKDGWTRDRLHSSKLRALDVPSLGSTLKVNVLNVRSVSRFYTHIPEMAKFYGPSYTFEYLENDLNKEEHRKDYKPFKTVPEPGCLALTKFKSSMYRCKVIENGVEGCEVVFIDYGFETHMKTEDLYEWPARYDFIPPLVYECELANIQTRLNDDSIAEQFGSLVVNQNGISANIVRYVGSKLLVRLTDYAGFDVGEILSAANSDYLSVYSSGSESLDESSVYPD